MLTYQLIKTNQEYGIQITYGNDIIRLIPNIACTSAHLSQLVEKCNRLQASLLHIDDIIYDFLCEE